MYELGDVIVVLFIVLVFVLFLVLVLWWMPWRALWQAWVIRGSINTEGLAPTDVTSTDNTGALDDGKLYHGVR